MFPQFLKIYLQNYCIKKGDEFLGTKLSISEVRCILSDLCNWCDLMVNKAFKFLINIIFEKVVLFLPQRVGYSQCLQFPVGFADRIFLSFLAKTPLSCRWGGQEVGAPGVASPLPEGRRMAGSSGNLLP